MNSRTIEPAKIPITAAIKKVFTLKIAPKMTRDNEIPAIIFKCFLFFRLIIGNENLLRIFLYQRFF